MASFENVYIDIDLILFLFIKSKLYTSTISWGIIEDSSRSDTIGSVMERSDYNLVVE